MQQSYDGNGLRGKKNDNGTVTYYVRSSVLGGQVVAELLPAGTVTRAYTYLGGQLLSLRNPGERGNGNYWVHEDPITKSKRVTNSLGTVVSWVELDPWGADTTRSGNTAFQPRTFTSYDRDGNKSDEAMFRRYNRHHSRFDQPDPYAGSYNATDPQSFNRYAYVQGDPVNFTDPIGLLRKVFCEEYVSEGNTTGAYCVVFGTPWGGFEPKQGGGGGPQNPAPDIHAIAELVNQELVESDCAEFAEAILNQLSKGKGGSLKGVFDAFLDQPKAHDLFTRTKPAGSWGESSPTGKIKNSTASIFSRSARAGENQTTLDADHAISELFHLARMNGLYDDKALANAARLTKYAGEAANFLAPSANIFDPGYNAGGWTEANQYGYSVYFHTIQKQHCGLLRPQHWK